MEKQEFPDRGLLLHSYHWLLIFSPVGPETSLSLVLHSRAADRPSPDRPPANCPVSIQPVERPPRPSPGLLNLPWPSRSGEALRRMRKTVPNTTALPTHMHAWY